jgi:thymidylate kinase
MGLGSLIVFEGPDGAGKSSIASRFTEYLNQSGSPARLFSFPGKAEGTLGWHVYQLHHNPRQFGIESLTPESLQTLHIAAHLDTIDQVLKPSLLSGTSIVLDRYWWSTWVYGREAGAVPETLDAVIKAEQLHWGSTQPSLLFLIARSDSLRSEESGPVWSRRLQLYRDLAAKPHSFPIKEIMNNATETDSLDAAIAEWTVVERRNPN